MSSSNPLKPWAPRVPVDHQRLNAGEARAITELAVGPGLTMARSGNSATIGLIPKHTPRHQQRFAKVTSVGAALSSGVIPHAWEEVRWDTTSGSWATLSGGLTGTTSSNYLVQSMGHTLDVNDVHPITPHTDTTTGDPFWMVHVTPGVMYRVSLTQTGGSAGNLTTQCSFTYTVKTLGAAVTIATGKTPEMQRPLVGKMAAATKGMGYWESDQDFILTWCDEVPTKAGC